MLKTIIVVMTLAAVPFTARAAAMLPGNTEHGKQLYQAQCAACHISQFGGDGSTIFTRKHRHVNNIDGLISQVGRCNQKLDMQLSSSNRHDIVKYLNDTYYKFQ